MPQTNITEELINILCDIYHFKIQKKDNYIVCDNGRLMGFPCQVWILPQFHIMCFYVDLKEYDRIVMSTDLKYNSDYISIDMMIENTIKKLITTIRSIVMNKRL